MNDNHTLAESHPPAHPLNFTPVCLPPMVNQETLLGDLTPAALDSRYIIVTDESHRIVGVVLTEEIRQKLATPNDRERLRWQGMALSFMVAVSFPAEADISTSTVSAVPRHPASQLFDNTACIATEQDLFLSWERISSVLAGAISDPLTGLPNRMAFDRRLNEEWNRSERTACSIGIILVDLDRFKLVNDLHGHAAGDAVLQDVALRLEDSLRSYDLVVRYGGDEFIALCLGCEPGEIEIPIRRIMENLRRSNVLADRLPRGIQASIGAAVQHFDFVGFKPKDLFSRADESLYRAKIQRGCAVYLDLHDSSSTHVTIVPQADDFPPRMNTEPFGAGSMGEIQ